MSNTRKFKAPEYVYFVYAAQTNASYGFSNYSDHNGNIGEPGSTVSIAYSLGKNNQPIPYHFSFSMRDRVIRVEKDKKDIKGLSVVEFLRNHPECKDSPNGYYNPATGVQEGVLFKEMNEEADAQVALKAKSLRLNAENIANNLELEDVIEINAILGNFKTGEAMNRHAILEVAGNKPERFMEAYENPHRRSLAVIRKGIDRKVLNTQGSSILWNKHMLGLDEIDAATNLQKEPKMLEALESAIKKVN